MPLQTDALNDLPLEIMSHGSAMYNTIRQIAGSLGTAVLVTIMSISASGFMIDNPGVTLEEGNLHGIKVAYLAVTLITLVATGLTLMLNDKKKA